MPNLIDYAETEWRRMDEKPFCAVDSLVLSQFVYVKLENEIPSLLEDKPWVRIADLLKAERFPSMFHLVRDAESNRRLLFALTASPRFRNIQMNYYAAVFDRKREEQFCAATFRLEDGSLYIAFRGTDATLVGWKEDFNMAFQSPIPSQEEGVRYLQAIAGKSPGDLRIGGHSKGGNIAVYSAVQCDGRFQNRILSVYSHDGPGFKDSLLESTGYQQISDRVHKTLPQSSMIGMLLESQENYSVVESVRYGVFQHDPFSWTVESGDFRYLQEITSGASYLRRTLNQWLGALSDEKRELFVDTLFQILEASEISSLSELSEDWKTKVRTMAGAVKNVDPEIKKFLGQTVNELLRLSFQNLPFPKAKIFSRNIEIPIDPDATSSSKMGTEGSEHGIQRRQTRKNLRSIRPNLEVLRSNRIVVAGKERLQSIPDVLRGAGGRIAGNPALSGAGRRPFDHSNAPPAARPQPGADVENPLVRPSGAKGPARSKDRKRPENHPGNERRNHNERF